MLDIPDEPNISETITALFGSIAARAWAAASGRPEEEFRAAVEGFDAEDLCGWAWDDSPGSAVAAAAVLEKTNLDKAHRYAPAAVGKWIERRDLPELYGAAAYAIAGKASAVNGTFHWSCEDLYQSVVDAGLATPELQVIYLCFQATYLLGPPTREWFDDAVGRAGLDLGNLRGDALVGFALIYRHLLCDALGTGETFLSDDLLARLAFEGEPDGVEELCGAVELRPGGPPVPLAKATLALVESGDCIFDFPAHYLLQCATRVGLAESDPTVMDAAAAAGDDGFASIDEIMLDPADGPGSSIYS